jgi:hypothetical protein
MSELTFSLFAARFELASSSRRASAGPSKPVAGKRGVSPVEQGSDHGQTSEPYDRPAPYCRVQLAKDLHASNPCAIWQTAVYLGHELFPANSEVVRTKTGCCDIRKTHLPLAIHTTQEVDFPHAQWAVPVVEDFDNRVSRCMGLSRNCICIQHRTISDLWTMCRARDGSKSMKLPEKAEVLLRKSSTSL